MNASTRTPRQRRKFLEAQRLREEMQQQAREAAALSAYPEADDPFWANRPGS